MASPTIQHDVRQYDSQADGMVIVSGWQVLARVTMPTGRKTAPVVLATCPDKDTAAEIAELLNAKYAQAE